MLSLTPRLKRFFCFRNIYIFASQKKRKNMKLMMVEQKPEGSNEDPAIREDRGKRTQTFRADLFTLGPEIL